MPATNAESLESRPGRGRCLRRWDTSRRRAKGWSGSGRSEWIRVRYLKENQAATIGWVSAQYVTLSQWDARLT